MSDQSDSAKVFSFYAWANRNIPDPVFEGAKQFNLLVRVNDFPTGIPLDPNPRKPDIDRRKWKEIQRHLMNEDGTPNSFHLKNKGITIIASDVKITNIAGSSLSKIDITIGEGDGIGDGGHTSTLIGQCQEQISKLLNSDSEFHQHVKVNVLVGYPKEIVNEVVRGLNTSIQVQERSLGDHRGDFDWIKQAIAGKDYASKISWTEGDNGEIDSVKSILVPMYVLHTGFFPNNGQKLPISGYTSVSKVLDHYLSNIEEYKKFENIIHEVLQLQDFVESDSRRFYNHSGGKAGKLTFMESANGGKHKFHFIGKESEYRLSRAALVPIVSAFRWLVEEDPETGKFRWVGGFDYVLNLWEEVAHRLIQQTQSTSLDNGRKIYAIGRSSNHWDTVYSTVGVAHFMKSK